jgi:Thioredoxin-like
MKATRDSVVMAAASMLAVICVSPQTGDAPNPRFPPFEHWKAAVLAGDAATLGSFYSTDPPAQVRVNSMPHDAGADVAFWVGLKARDMKTEVVRNEPRHGHISYIFRAQVEPASGSVLNVTEDQSWKQQASGWKLIDVERTDAPHLAQPADMKKDIYPANADAHAEIREAEEEAVGANKRLLLVFGANWCFDCHVLDLAFQRPDIAPVLAANYAVIHVDLGPVSRKTPIWSTSIRFHSIRAFRRWPSWRATASW